MSVASPETRPSASIPYRIIEHTADTGFEVTGDSPARLFEHAAMVLFRLIWKQEGKPAAGETEKKIEVRAGDLPELMVNFLQEFLYLYDAEGLVFTGVQVDSVSETSLSGRAWGHRFEEGIDEELLGVKAITYHQLFVGRKETGWRARVLLDI